MYYLTAFRGLLQGYENGLYGNSSIVVSQACFGQSTLDAVVTLDKIFASGDIGAFFGSASQFYLLTNGLQKSCMFYELFHDSFSFVLSGTVSPTQIASNFTANLFKLTAALNEIFSVVFGDVQP